MARIPSDTSSCCQFTLEREGFNITSDHISPEDLLSKSIDTSSTRAGNRIDTVRCNFRIFPTKPKLVCEGTTWKQEQSWIFLKNTIKLMFAAFSGRNWLGVVLLLENYIRIKLFCGKLRKGQPFVAMSSNAPSCVMLDKVCNYSFAFYVFPRSANRSTLPVASMMSVSLI